MLDREKYKLSTYQTIETLRRKENSVVELVESTLDGMKYIKKTYHEDKRMIYRLLAEIKNDSIPEIYEIFFGEDTIIIEQYMEGKTLHQLITEKHIFSKTEIQRIIDSLTEGIAFLHQKSIIHRDIKPSNIVITSEGKAVLIDYGIARIYTAKKANDTEYYGTAGYAAPEQFGFRQSDFRTDIYALGMTLQQIVSPHNASQTTIKAIDKCTEFAPNQRFRSIDELREHLVQEEKRRRIKILMCTIIACCLLIGACLWTADRTAPQTSDMNAVITVEQTQDMQKEPTKATTEADKAEVTEQKQSGTSTQTPSPAKANVSNKLGTHAELIDLMHSGGQACCLPLKERRQTISIDLGNGRQTYIDAERSDTTIRVTINKTISFTFSDDRSLPRTSYPNGDIMAELIFYDMNNDGIFEIIPIISNAIRTKWNDGSIVVQKNYSLGWCIYLNGESYIRAENRMAALLDTFKIDARAPGCIWTDFPACYKLIDGKMVLFQ